MDIELEKAFWLLHRDLPRQAPGSDDSTLKLLQLANLPHNAANALDIGCGPGRSSLLLAEQGLQVTAIDTSQKLLREFAETLKSNQVGNIQLQNMSMFEMEFEPQSFDLIWAEGSAYIAGWKMAVKEWTRLLRPDGRMVITECVWQTESPSAEIRKFWDEAYPEMLTVEQAEQIAAESGLIVSNKLTLPDSDWWAEYYSLIEQRIDQLSKTPDRSLRSVVEATEMEIRMRRQFSSEYDYVGFVMELGP